MGMDDDKDRMAMIVSQRHRYAEPRKVRTLRELAKCVDDGTCIM